MFSSVRVPSRRLLVLGSLLIPASFAGCSDGSGTIKTPQAEASKNPSAATPPPPSEAPRPSDKGKVRYERAPRGGGEVRGGS